MPLNQPRYRWRDLNGVQRAALDDQIVGLTDAFADDLIALEAGAPFADTSMARYLPPQFGWAYTPAFARKFLVSFLTVTWKLKDPAHVHTCATLAEQLALYALIQATEATLPSGIDDLDGFAAAAFEHFNLHILFSPALAPFKASVVAANPQDWFAPLTEDRTVHPYMAAEV